MEVKLDKRWLLVGGASFAVFLVLLIAAWLIKSIDIPLVGDGQASSQAKTGSQGALGGGPTKADLARCATLWNKPSNDYGRQLISGYSTEPPYIYVDFSATFPDRCLITAANLETGSVYQFLERGEQTAGDLGPFGLPAAQPSINDLPPTDWNAGADQNGYILLGD